MKPLAILGLDSFPWPFLSRYRESFPFFSSLLQKEKGSPFASCHPPITIPAWSVLTTGKDPGELGVYGFKRRCSANPMDDVLVHGGDITYPRVWDTVLNKGGRALVWGVPQTFPYAVKPGLEIGGCILDEGLLGLEAQPDFQARMCGLVGNDYIADASGYRTEELDLLQHTLQTMLQQKKQILKDMLTQKADFSMLVLMETDRLNHAFYRFVNRDHPQFEDQPQRRRFFLDFYREIDAIAQSFWEQFLDLGHEVCVLSDHGARILHGMFRLNEWLIRRGYLVLRKQGFTGILKAEDVDWAGTRAYSSGGYCGRLWLNRKDREPGGIVEDGPRLLEQIQKELGQDLQELGLSCQFHRTEEVWRGSRRLNPEALIYVSDLDYRISAQVGEGGLILPLNDSGPDGVNHDFTGIFFSSGPRPFPADLVQARSYLEERMME